MKGYATHEREVFEKATKARAEAMSARGVGETAQAEEQLTGALTDLRAVAENYPQLRATENFQQLMRNLSELEDEIQASRRIYNSNVQSYNTKIQLFPNSIVANQGGFTEREFFEIEDASERRRRGQPVPRGGPTTRRRPLCEPPPALRGLPLRDQGAERRRAGVELVELEAARELVAAPVLHHLVAALVAERVAAPGRVTRSARRRSRPAGAPCRGAR